MGTIILKKNRKKRIESGHPWVYQSEIDRVEGNPTDGDVVLIVNHQAHVLAKALWNGQSQIAARIISYDPAEEIDSDLFLKRIQNAWNVRQQLLANPASCRVVYGEADFMPGLIVDRYGDYLSIQIVSLGMDQ